MSTSIDTLAGRPTPLLRWGPALLKLELYRAPRSLPLQPFAATGHHALARARQGMQVRTLGAVTHEMRKTLEIWGAQTAGSAAPRWQPDPADLVRELLEELAAPPPLVVAPAADSAALLALLEALQAKWPEVRGVALLADGAELPDLPLQSDLPVEQLRVTSAAASKARARVASSLGLLASHASAAAAVHAFEHGGLALVTAPGEREFSLEPR